jgi:thiamine-monophosphate kinase
MKISDLGGETALISLIRDRFGAAGAGDLALGIGDDAALLDTGGERLLIVTTDLLVEGTHFRMDLIDPYLLGWKSVAVNISDIAAMGGEPTYCFVSIGTPDIEVSVVERIYEGMYDVSAGFGSAIAGGDTVGSDRVVINVVQLGTVERDLAAKRSGAKPGDAIIVTNTIGDSRAGLELLLKLGLEEARRVAPALVERHLKPEPRVPEARAAVLTGKVRSMMDLSDGLSADLTKLCKASGVGARVYARTLPISEDTHIAAARLDADAVALAASGGEDYELLLTCDPLDAERIVGEIGKTGSTARAIGEIVDSEAVLLIHSNGVEHDMPASWEHF